jgi:tetratricopeptide (TPR) repeat protein
MSFQPQSSDLYARLGLQAECPDADIKKAFFKAVREFPPEKEEANYKLVREAYDTLSNPTSRTEYDTRAKFGPDIERLESELKAAADDEDIDLQVALLKKLITMAPRLAIYRNRLGLVFMEAERYSEGLIQFQRAVQLDPKSMTYVMNCGHAEENLENFAAAERHFLQACNMDLEDYAGPRALASLYFYNMERKADAHKVLDRAIAADGKQDFQDFFCIFDKVFFYCVERDKVALKRELARILQVAQSPADRDFASYMLAKRAFDLNSWKAFDLAASFSEAAVRLSPDDENVKRLHNAVTEDHEVIQSIEALTEAAGAHDITKAVLTGIMYVRAEMGTEAERRKITKDVAEMLEAALDTRPDYEAIKSDVASIARNHRALYVSYKDLFDSIRNAGVPTWERLACPHCSDLVRVEIHERTSGSCPHCHRGIIHIPGLLMPHEAPKPSSGGCFIATAVYGDYEHDDVRILRTFRDDVLMRSGAGRAFVRVYYRFSPPLAERLVDMRSTRAVLKRWVFAPIAKSLDRAMRVRERSL